MSVDKTIEELSGTLAQLGVLVEHINAQIIGITSRINLTLDNFDHSVAGIATDAGLMTGQVSDTISQLIYIVTYSILNLVLLCRSFELENPVTWVMIFSSFISALVKIIVEVVVYQAQPRGKKKAKIRDRMPNYGATTPLPSMIYSESKQPLNVSYPGSPRDRLRHIAVPMETEPRRFGFGSQFAPMQSGGSGEFTLGTRGSYAHQIRSQEVPEPYISRRQPYQTSPTEFDGSPRRFNSENGDGLQREAVLLQSQYQSTSTVHPPFISPRAEAV